MLKGLYALARLNLCSQEITCNESFFVLTLKSDTIMIVWAYLNRTSSCSNVQHFTDTNNMNDFYWTHCQNCLTKIP